MRLDDLEEIFEIAYASEPNQTDYYLTKILLSMPSQIEIPGRRGLNEYELDEPSIYRENLEKKRLENLISKLRSSRIK